VEGDAALVPAQRAWRVLLHGIAEPGCITVALNGVPQTVSWAYHAAREELSFAPISLAPGDRLDVRVETVAGSLLGQRDRRAEAVRHLLWNFKVDNIAVLQELDDRLPELLDGSLPLEVFANRLKGAHLNALRDVLT